MNVSQTTASSKRSLTRRSLCWCSLRSISTRSCWRLSASWICNQCYHDNKSSSFASQQDPLWTDHTHTHPFSGPLSGTTRVSWYQNGITNLDYTEARDSEWQRHQLGHMKVCTSLQTDNHASTPPLSFLQAGCPSCHPTNSVKGLKDSQSTRETDHT